MCRGEFESLKAIQAVSPGFVPKPYAWGRIGNAEGGYFLLVEFRHIKSQVSDPPFLLLQISRMTDHLYNTIKARRALRTSKATCRPAQKLHLADRQVWIPCPHLPHQDHPSH